MCALSAYINHSFYKFFLCEIEKVNKKVYHFFMGKLLIWSLSFIIYFNLIPNILIVLIWFLTF